MCGFIESLSQGSFATFKSRCRIERMYLRRLQAKHGASYQCVRLVVFLISSTLHPCQYRINAAAGCPLTVQTICVVYMAPIAVASFTSFSFSDCLSVFSNPFCLSIRRGHSSVSSPLRHIYFLMSRRLADHREAPRRKCEMLVAAVSVEPIWGVKSQSLAGNAAEE